MTDIRDLDEIAARAGTAALLIEEIIARLPRDLQTDETLNSGMYSAVNTLRRVRNDFEDIALSMRRNH